MQIGNIVSISPMVCNLQLNWSVMFSYALDAGGTAQGQVYIGPLQSSFPTLGVNGIPGGNWAATVTPWASPTSTIAIPLNQTPGTTNQVLLNCPPLAAAAIFNLPLH